MIVLTAYGVRQARRAYKRRKAEKEAARNEHYSDNGGSSQVRPSSSPSSPSQSGPGSAPPSHRTFDYFSGASDKHGSASSSTVVDPSSKRPPYSQSLHSQPSVADEMREYQDYIQRHSRAYLDDGHEEPPSYEVAVTGSTSSLPSQQLMADQYHVPSTARDWFAQINPYPQLPSPPGHIVDDGDSVKHTDQSESHPRRSQDTFDTHTAEINVPSHLSDDATLTVISPSHDRVESYPYRPRRIRDTDDHHHQPAVEEFEFDQSNDRRRPRMTEKSKPRRRKRGDSSNSSNSGNENVDS